MSKALLLSIKPKWVVKILNKEKTIEIRKSSPKCELPIDVYIYCTKDKQGIWLSNGKYDLLNENKYVKSERNGKVVAKFTLNKVEEIKPFEVCESPFGLAYKLTKDKVACCQKAQLTYDEYNHYLKGEKGYAWHIDNLVIFDRPKELSEFKPFNNGMPQYKFIKNGCEDIKLTKVPQSFMYVDID